MYVFIRFDVNVTGRDGALLASQPLLFNLVIIPSGCELPTRSDSFKEVETGGSRCWSENTFKQ